MTANKNKILKKAFQKTVPVLFGYIFMGMAFGILLSKAGFNALWALFMSVIVFAGTAQFIAVDFLKNSLDFITVAMTTLLINFRHVVYGLSFIERFSKMGKKRFFMMFGLTDETYALLCAERDGDMWDNDTYLLTIAFLNYLYWITGCVLGALLGEIITFDTTGVDFAMTSLFIVICTEQWQNAKTHIPVYVGAIASLLALLIFGADNILIPSVVVILISLIVLRKNITKHFEEENNAK